MEKIFYLAQNLGNVQPPPGVKNFSSTGSLAGVSVLITVIVRTIIVGASLYAFISLAVAGYMFIGAGGDSKQVGAAWARIWQTLLGLAISAGAFVLAAIFGMLIFGDPTYLLQFRVFTP